MKDLKYVQNDVKNRLTEKRYIHSEGVMKRAKYLAMLNNADVEKAMLIGIAHDVAKELETNEYIKICEKNNIEIDEVERKVPKLLHAKVGAFICKAEYGFDDQMCRAIINHTVGDENMDIYSKIIIAADKTEENRKFEDLEYVKELTEKNLDEGVKYILEVGIINSIKYNSLIHPKSLQARNALYLQLNEAK